MSKLRGNRDDYNVDESAINDGKKSQAYGANQKLKRKIFQKLGYQGYSKEELIPDEIFQMLWLIQQNEDSLFLKSAKEYASTKILDRPKRRLDAMIDLRTELNSMCDTFAVSVKRVTDRILSEIHDPDADEGLLEIEFQKYMECFHVDLGGFDDLLVKEIQGRRTDLSQAEQAAHDLVTQMRSVLGENEAALKGFMEESKYNVEYLSKSIGQRNKLQKEEFKERMMRLQGLSMIESNLKTQKEGESEVAANAALNDPMIERQMVVGLMRQEGEDLGPINPGERWKARIHKTEPIGKGSRDSRNQFQWPTQNELLQLPLDQQVKLNGIGLRANTNLYQMKLAFTGGVQSDTFTSLGGVTSEPKIDKVNPAKIICAVEVNIRPEESNIYGIRFLDYNNKSFYEKQWKRTIDAKWARIEVPAGMEIIGFHGSHDGDNDSEIKSGGYIKQLGLVLWTPNPKAAPMRNR